MTAWAGAGSLARAELLPLECDDGASVSLTYLDSSPEFEHQDELGECNEAPVGEWNRVGLARQTDAATVDAFGFVRSEDGCVLEVANQLALDVENGELAGIVVLVEGEARFRAPEADDDVPADVILERYAHRRPPCRVTEATREDRRHSQQQKAAGRECACSEWQATKEESS